MNHRILSGSALKLIAMVSMVVDHSALFLLKNQLVLSQSLFSWHGREITWYYLMRCFGRLAFPIFAFLIVEGFIHTHDRLKYGRNLLIFALISEIPWALLHNGFHMFGHNVIFTLLWGFLGLCAIDRFRDDWRRIGLILIAMLGVAFVFRADYGGPGFAFIILLYALRRHLALQALVGCCILPMKWVAGLAFIPIGMYNGERGFIRGQVGKYLFYIFYPAHLLLLYFLQGNL